MPQRALQLARIFAIVVLASAMADASWAGRVRQTSGEPVGHLVFASPQSNPIAVSADGSRLYIANTSNHTLGIQDGQTLTLLKTVRVGIDPVSVAIRPGGNEVWVSNHVSDSVSVVDVNPASATYGNVVETIQDMDASGATLFDEPVGIAFTADGQKAYVALSSRNQIAVIDANTYQVTGFIQVRAQDPRAIAVRNGLLFVIPFESGNQTQLSACANLQGTGLVGDPCSLGLSDLLNFAQEPNLPNAVKNIIVDPNAPDRDLFVYDTQTDQEVAAISHLGTLLYGIAVDSTGRVYISETDARNAVNGNDGDVLASLDDRMFDNDLVSIPCSSSGCGTPDIVNLEPGGTTHANSLATPYGLALDEANGHLIMTAAAASRIASFDTSLSGGPISVLDVGAIPRGIAFHPTTTGGFAYVLNSLDDTVSKVSVAKDGTLAMLTTASIGNDPTPPAVRRGEIAFNNAFASTTGNFACASCHPDGNTDQLLWRIGGSCTAIGCNPGDEPRSTMPIRGLKNTIPLHWDGVFADPFGGGNGSVGVNGNGGTDCTLGSGQNGDHACFLTIVVGTLAGPMCQQPCSNPELTTQERDDMATFIANVDYPPARSRRMDDHVSRSSDPALMGSTQVNALQGFSDFFTNVNGATSSPQSCADSTAGCHALPLGTSTNSPTLDGFDAPTMRGMTDRFLQFSNGLTNPVPLLVAANSGLGGASPLEAPIQWDPNIGYREATTFGVAFAVFQPVYGVRPLNLFQMFEEASTGFSGALGRQLTLNTTTATLSGTVSMMTALESADQKGVVNLRAVGERNGNGITLSFQSGHYQNGSISLTPDQLRSEASQGQTLVTLTAELRQNLGTDPQPLLATVGPPSGNGTGPIDNPPLPDLTTGGGATSFAVTGTDVNASAAVFLDGDPASGASVGCTPDSTGYCPNGAINIDLASTPAAGIHLLQVQNPSGWLSNEMPICVGPGSGCTTN